MINDYQSKTKYGFINCFCKNNQIDEEFIVGGEKKQICLEWAQAKNLSYYIPFGIAFIILVINVILQETYKSKLNGWYKYILK